MEAIEGFFGDPPYREWTQETERGLSNWIREQITAVLDDSIPPDDFEDKSAPHLNILIGGAELEQSDPDKLQRVKLTFNTEDRKWITSHENGEKVYTLDR